MPPVHAQRVKWEREASQERLGAGAFRIAAGAGAVEPSRSLVFDRPTRRRARALGRVGVDQKLPVDEPHSGDPQAVQGTRDPQRLQTAGYARRCWWRAFPIELCDPNGLIAIGQRGVPPLCLPQQPSDLRRIRDRHVQRRRGRPVGVADRQRVKGQRVEMRRVQAADVSLQAQHFSQERHRRDAPLARGFSVRSDTGGRHRIGRPNRLDAGIERIEQLAIEQRRKGSPAAARSDPLGLQIAREVWLVPGLEQPHPRQHTTGRRGIGERPVIATRKRGGELFERRRTRGPATEVRVGPAIGRFGKRRRMGDDEQGLEALLRGALHGGVEPREPVGGARRVARLKARRRRGHHEFAPADRDTRGRRPNPTDARELQFAHPRVFAQERYAVGHAAHEPPLRERAVEQGMVLCLYPPRAGMRRSQPRRWLHTKWPWRSFCAATRGDWQDGGRLQPDDRTQGEPERLGHDFEEPSDEA